MRKRDFRPAAGAGKTAPTIPTLEAFDGDRRAFLARLGAVLGLSALGSALSACGERNVYTGDGGVDPEPEVAGGAPMPPAEADAQIARDAGVPLPEPGGAAPLPDARVDPAPDWSVQGKAPAPDARVDSGPDWGTMGIAPEPDARVDPEPDWGLGGVAPAPDARAD